MGLSDSVTDESEICVFIPSKRLEQSLKLPTHRPTPTFKDNMKAAILAIVLFGLASAASAQEYDMEESEARFLYFNSSSTATSLTRWELSFSSELSGIWCILAVFWAELLHTTDMTPMPKINTINKKPNTNIDPTMMPMATKE